MTLSSRSYPRAARSVFPRPRIASSGGLIISSCENVVDSDSASERRRRRRRVSWPWLDVGLGSGGAYG